MATANLSSFSWKGQYSSSSGYLWNQNCYCNPAYVYFWIPAAAGQETGRSIEVHLPIVYTNKSIPCYATLTVNGKEYYASSYPKYVTPTASGINMSVTFNNMTIPAGGANGTLWLDFGDYNTVQLYTSLWSPYGYMYYTAVTPCGAPSSIWGDKSRVIPGQSYTFSWSGATSGVSNSIKDYYIAYQYGSGDWTYASTASTSYTFTPSTDYRGSTLRFAVQTRGSAGSSYYSSWAYSGYYTINSLPPAPSVSTNTSYYSYDNGGDITFTASAGADAEGDSLTIQYSTNSSFSSYSTYSSAFTQKFSSGTSDATYYFRTYDGYEYSSTTSKSVSRNTPPTINNLGLGYTSLTGKDSSETYIRSITTSPTISKSVTYIWTLYYNSTKSISGASSVQLSTSANNTFSLTDYKGNYILLRLTVNDGYDTRYSESSWFLIPKDISSATSVSITNGSGANVVEPIGSTLYTGNMIYINWSLPAIENSQLSRYSYVELQKWNGSSWSFVKTYPATDNTTSEKTYEEEYSLPSDIEYNTVYRVIVYTKEQSPGTQSASYVYTTKNLQRAPKPALASENSSLVIEPSTIRPTSGNTGILGKTTSGSSLIFTHNVENKIPNLGAKWTLTATVNGKVITLMSKKKVADTVDGIVSETVDDAKITHTFANAKWKSLFSQPTWNNSYSVKITLTLENDLGDSVEAIASATLTADYCEPVSWTAADSVFTERIRYADNLIGNELTSTGTKSNNAAFLVNAGEIVQLTIPSITDLNNDTNKRVYIERGIVSDWSNSLSIIKNATDWLEIGIFTPSSSINTYEYIIPDIEEDAFYVFRAWIKGSNNLVSIGDYIDDNYKYAYSPTVVRACRSREPSIQITTVSDTDNNTGVFTIVPEITLKGSTDYSTYKNWEREGIINGYPTKNITIVAEICNDGLFDSAKETYLSQTILNGYSGDYSSVNSTIFSTITKSDFAKMTLFVRLNISLNTGFGTILTSTSPIYTFYAMVPTVSHRSHQVGINTNKFDTGEIFALAMPSTDKNKLRFSGEEETSVINLYLDLSNLTLSSKVGTNNESPSKIKFGTNTEAKITSFDLSTCTVTTSLKGSTAGVALDSFTIDGGTW